MNPKTFLWCHFIHYEFCIQCFCLSFLWVILYICIHSMHVMFSCNPISTVFQKKKRKNSRCSDVLVFNFIIYNTLWHCTTSILNYIYKYTVILIQATWYFLLLFFTFISFILHYINTLWYAFMLHGIFSYIYFSFYLFILFWTT